MSVVASTIKGAGLAAATGAATAVAVPPPKDPSVWAIVVLGIPLFVLAASIAAAAFRHIREHGQPDSALPQRVIWIVIDGFIGGWLAMFIVTLPITRPYFDGVSPAIIGALFALGLQFIRDRGPGWADLFVTNVLGWFGKRQATRKAGDP